MAAGALASVQHLKQDNDLRIQHQKCARVLKARLKLLGLPVLDNNSHIVPLVIGNPVHAKLASDQLLNDHGIYVQPINYPTVPKGTERLRFTPSPLHGRKVCDELITAMDELWTQCRLSRIDVDSEALLLELESV